MTPLTQNILVFAFIGIFILIVTLFVRSPRWARPLSRFSRSYSGWIALTIVVIYLVIATSNLILTPWAQADGRPMSLLDLAFKNVPKETSYSAPFTKIDFKNRKLLSVHILGTDALGKDVLQQTMKGASTALLIGTLTSLIYIPIGVILGISAGYYKRYLDDIVQYLYSTVASIPGILLLVAIMIVLGKGIPQISFALGITGWIGLCRLLRGETLRQTERQYCEAARALGERDSSIIFRHILPNVMHLVMINFVLGFSGIILAEAILSYIGVGVPIGTASWGAMIDAARMELSREPKVWWNILSATGALFILVLSLNLLGDALRKAFDPKAP
ncbi:MAG: ABC transporter permease [Chthoniobacterales bacterium]